MAEHGCAAFWHRSSAVQVGARRTALTVVRGCGLVFLYFSLRFCVRGQASEDYDVIHRCVVVMRRMYGAGQVLAVQVQQRRAANFLASLLQLGALRFKFITV